MTIPEGMVPWAGGDSAPADWDGGPVLLADGDEWAHKDATTWTHDCGTRNVIAYTPAASPAHATPDVGEVTEAGDFNRGYMIAVANLMNLHGDEVIARDVLMQLGASREDMEALDLTDYDLEPLRALFDEIDRRAALQVRP